MIPSLTKPLTALVCASLVTFPVVAQEVADKKGVDLINFKNDDLLHGKFQGFTTSGKIIWNHLSAEGNIAFSRAEVRKIVANKGKLTKPFSHTSFVKLKTTDVIPGKITSMSDENLTIETDYSDTFTIPKNLVSNIEFNPIGSHIIYRGPFSEEDGWKISYPERYKPKKDVADKDKKPASWTLKNFSLQHQGNPSSFVKEHNLPDKFRITYNSYFNRSSPSIILLADLSVPEIDEENSTVTRNRTRYNSTVAGQLGTCLLLRPSSSGQLSHFSFSDDGSINQNIISNTLKTSSKSFINNKTFYDIRVDTTTGLIMLYQDKKHIGQWRIDKFKDKFKGQHIGFNMNPYSNPTENKTTLSDIVISKWNGVQDSAISLENNERDIVMLDNGTDRYSGKVTSITQDSVQLKSNYAELSIPHDQVSSVTFASDKVTAPPARQKDDVTIKFYGTGKLTGKVSKADKGYIKIDSKTLGSIKVAKEFISSYEFINMDDAYEPHN